MLRLRLAVTGSKHITPIHLETAAGGHRFTTHFTARDALTHTAEDTSYTADTQIYTNYVLHTYFYIQLYLYTVSA